MMAIDWYVGGINDEASQRLLPVSRATRKPDPVLDIAIIIYSYVWSRVSVQVAICPRCLDDFMVYTFAWEGPV